MFSLEKRRLLLRGKLNECFKLCDVFTNGDKIKFFMIHDMFQTEINGRNPIFNLFSSFLHHHNSFHFLLPLPSPIYLPPSLLFIPSLSSLLYRVRPPSFPHPSLDT